jgi:eukaryotic-like serine/threonine-protein kinase
MRRGSIRGSIRSFHRVGFGRLEAMIAGVRFGRFQALRELGRGAMGVVYLAADPNDLQPVAVKLLHSPLPALEARFKREFRVLQKLDSPHVVGVLEFGAVNASEAHSFIVMEFVEGKDLAQWSADIPQTPEEFRRLVALLVKIADGLGAVHRAGVIHRDLKPENILVTPDDTPKLTDFGLARDDTASVALTIAGKGGFMGTLLYAAPEQIQSRGVDHRADLYALGMVMYRLFTGRTAFEGQAISQIILSHLREPPAPPTTLNPTMGARLETLILDLLAKNPSERPDSADAVRERLEALLRDADVDPTASATSLSLALTGEEAALELLEPPFVGREALLGAIVRAPTNAVLLSGEGGVGKTRLLLEVRRDHQLFGSRALSANAVQGAPLAVVAQWLRGALQRRSTALEVVLESDGAVLSNLVPEIGVAPLPLNVDGAQFTLYASALRALSASSGDEDRGLLLTLENAHDADEGSLNFVAYALRSLSDNPRLRFALTSRSEAEHPIWRALETEGLLTRFTVPPLEPDDARHAVRAMLGGLADEALVEHVSARSGGNPWMAGEILRALIESGAAFRYRRYWEWTRVGANLTLPLSETLRARYAKLEAGPRELAATAAAIGETVGFEALLALSGAGEDAMLDDLEQLIRARILLEERLGREEVYRFAHPLLRDAALEDLSGRKRRRLHARYAELLRVQNADPARLAEHYLQSEQTDDAFAATLLAARNAEALYLLPTVEHLVRRTHALLSPDDPRRDTLEVYLGRIGAQIGRSSEAELFLENVFERGGGQTTQARVALAELYRRTGRWQEAIELLHPVIDDLHEPQAWVTLISAFRFSGQANTALTYLERAEHRFASELSSNAIFHHQKAETYFQLERIEEARTHCQQALLIARDHGDAHTEAVASVLLGRIHQMLEQPEAEIAAYEKAVGSFRLIGDMRGIVGTELNISAVLSDQEQFEDAIALLEQVVELSARTSIRDALANAYFNLADCYVRLGQREQATMNLERAAEVAQEINDLELIAELDTLRQQLI